MKFHKVEHDLNLCNVSIVWDLSPLGTNLAVNVMSNSISTREVDPSPQINSPSKICMNFRPDFVGGTEPSQIGQTS